MNEIKEKAKRWIENYRLSTQMVKDVPDDKKLSNGWGKRELLLHLWGWDEEFYSIAERIVKGETITEYYDEKTLDEFNNKVIEENKNLQLNETKEKFAEMRIQMIQIYEKVVDKHIKDDKHILNLFTLWYHDVHHLKQADVNVEKLKENE